MCDLTHNGTDPREDMGRSIRYAARLSSLLAVTPHHPTLDQLLADLVIDIEALWLASEELQEDRT